MAKLVEILAREYTIWPSRCTAIEQDWDGRIWEADFDLSRIARLELADDWHDAVVTRYQWEVERARIAANQQATTEAQEIATAGTITSEEQELAAISRGKRSKEDQALWDKVAVSAMQSLTQTYWDRIEKYDSAEQLVQRHIGSAFDYADAFMTERAKRMENNQ